MIANRAGVAQPPFPAPHATTGARIITAASLAGIFLAPYTTWRLIPDTLFTFSDGLFALAALLLLSSGRRSIEPFADLTPLWLIALATMLAGLLLGSVVNGDLGRWLIVAAQYCFAYGLLPVSLSFRTRDNAITAMKALVAGIAAMELFGTAVYISTGADYTRAQQLGPEFITGAHRLGAFMADANWNGAMSAMAIPFTLFLFGSRRISGPVATVALGILGCGVVLSGSFTGFTSAALATFLFTSLATVGRVTRLVAGIVAAAALALAAGVAMPSTFERRVVGALENRDMAEAGTYTGRMELIEEAWHIVDRTSIVGLGVDQFRVVSVDEAPVHNLYLLMWAEGGILALTGWLVMATVPIIAATRAFRRDRQAAALCLAVTSVFLTFSLAAPHMYARSWVVPLLIAMAMLFTREGERRMRA